MSLCFTGLSWVSLVVLGSVLVSAGLFAVNSLLCQSQFNALRLFFKPRFASLTGWISLSCFLLIELCVLDCCFLVSVTLLSFFTPHARFIGTDQGLFTRFEWIWTDFQHVLVGLITFSPIFLP